MGTRARIVRAPACDPQCTASVLLWCLLQAVVLRVAILAQDAAASVTLMAEPSSSSDNRDDGLPADAPATPVSNAGPTAGPNTGSTASRKRKRFGTATSNESQGGAGGSATATPSSTAAAARIPAASTPSAQLENTLGGLTPSKKRKKMSADDRAAKDAEDEQAKIRRRELALVIYMYAREAGDPVQASELVQHAALHGDLQYLKNKNASRVSNIRGAGPWICATRTQEGGARPRQGQETVSLRPRQRPGDRADDQLATRQIREQARAADANRRPCGCRELARRRRAS